VAGTLEMTPRDAAELRVRVARPLIAVLVGVGLLVQSGQSMADDANQRNVAAIARVNEVRIAMGLDPLVADLALQKAALAHARYEVVNNTLGHSEVPGAPGFTGAGPGERANAAGFMGPLSEVVTSGGGDGRGVDDWLSSVYHRHVLLDPTARLMADSSDRGGEDSRARTGQD